MWVFYHQMIDKLFMFQLKPLLLILSLSLKLRVRVMFSHYWMAIITYFMGFILKFLIQLFKQVIVTNLKFVLKLTFYFRYFPPKLIKVSAT